MLIQRKNKKDNVSNIKDISKSHMYYPLQKITNIEPKWFQNNFLTDMNIY